MWGKFAMHVADRMIDQTFSDADVDQRQYARLVIGIHKAIQGQDVRSIVLIDNGLAGKKLMALTTANLVIVDEAGGISDQWPIDDIEDIRCGWNTVKITHRFENGHTGNRMFNQADTPGIQGLQREFYELQAS